MLDYSGVSMLDIKIPDKFNIADEILNRNIESGRGDKAAIICHDEQITYHQLLERSNRIGNALQSLGVEQENRVMLLLFDCPEAIYSMLGAMKLGAVPFPASTMTVPDDYEYFLNDSRAKALIVDEKLLPLIDPIRKNCIHLKHVVVLGQPRAGELGYRAITEAASRKMQAAATHKDDMAFWLYSSGTTGRPKGIVHLHHDMVYTSEAWYMRCMLGRQQDVLYSAAKIFFGIGAANSVFFSPWAGSTTVLVPERPTPEIIMETIERYRVTFLCAAPTIYAGVLRLKDYDKYDLCSVRVAISGGEALPRPIYDEWESRFGIQILDGVGSSDLELNYTQNPPGENKPGTIGKFVEGYEGKIIDEKGQLVAPGEVGELVIKGDSAPPFYWNKHEKSKQAILGEWFKTGDTVYQDEEGYIHYVGRADDVFKSSGVWVSPAEVEGVLIAHEHVLEAGVVGLPVQDGLIKTAAFVVLEPGVEPSESLAEELIAYSRSKLVSHKVPRQLIFVSTLPRTATGKIQRYKLRQETLPGESTPEIASTSAGFGANLKLPEQVQKEPGM